MIVPQNVINQIHCVEFSLFEPLSTTTLWAYPVGQSYDYRIFLAGQWVSVADGASGSLEELIQRAELAIKAAVAATEGAENVNATLVNNVLTITDREGNSTSIDLSGQGGGSVNSVNGKTGDVVLNANDVDALPANTEYQSPINDLESIRSGAQSGATAYQKPNTGIPSTDLSSAVQVSLRKADSALQTETDPTVPSWAKQSSKPTYTAQEVGALPDDTPLFSGDYNDLSNKPTIPTALSQLSEDSTHRVVSDAEKTTWNNKSNFSGSYNDLTDKPTIPDVPTNVSAFNNDAGYLTQHQDISGKEDVTTIVAPVNETDATLPIISLACEVGKYYRLDVAIETLAVTLPAMTDLTTVKTVVIYLTAGTTPAVTIATADSKDVYYQDGYAIESGKTYEVNCLWNGSAWIVASVDIVVPVEEEKGGE